MSPPYSTRLTRERSVPCPMCGHALRGSRFVGFTCTSCASHFSGKFIVHSQRQQFKTLIREHFDARPKQPASSSLPKTIPTQTAQERFVVPDNDHRIVRAITEAQEAAKNAKNHLETLLESTTAIPVIKAPAISIEPAQHKATHGTLVQKLSKPKTMALRKAAMPVKKAILPKQAAKQKRKPKKRKSSRIPAQRKPRRR